jgi:hypothetical protein
LTDFGSKISVGNLIKFYYEAFPSKFGFGNKILVYGDAKLDGIWEISIFFKIFVVQKTKSCKFQCHRHVPRAADSLGQLLKLKLKLKLILNRS